MSSVLGRDCYDLGHENCASDSRCVLEYNIENENPTCVPRQDQRQLTDHEVRVLERVFEQILVQFFPSGNAVAGNAFNQSIQRVVHELRPMVDWKIRSLTSEGSISSWTNGIANVSRNIIGIVNLPGQDLQQVAQQDAVQAAIRRVLDERREIMNVRHNARYQRYQDILQAERLQYRLERDEQREAHLQRQLQRQLHYRNVMANFYVVVIVIFALIYNIDLAPLIIGGIFY